MCTCINLCCMSFCSCTKMTFVVVISVISRPPAVTMGGCHVVSLLAVAGILKCLHDQALHVNTPVNGPLEQSHT